MEVINALDMFITPEQADPGDIFAIELKDIISLVIKDNQLNILYKRPN